MTVLVTKEPAVVDHGALVALEPSSALARVGGGLERFHPVLTAGSAV